MSQIFPNLSVGNENLVIVRGLEYSLRIEIPADRLGLNSFRGYWIKTEIRFRFLKSLNGEIVSDMLTWIYRMDTYLVGRGQRHLPPDTTIIWMATNQVDSEILLYS